MKNTDGDLEEACGGGDGSFHDDSFHDASDVPREKPQAMTLINQIVQPDCVPVLEYHIVSSHASLGVYCDELVCVCVCDCVCVCVEAGN